MSSAADSQAFEMSLRDQLIAAQHSQNAQSNAPPPPPPPPPAHDAYAPHSHPTADHHHNQLDTVLGIQYHGGPQQASNMGQGHLQGPEVALTPAQKRKNQRELSNTKRAAQNRAAQRAFRMRKEAHIAKLEEEARGHQVIAAEHKQLQQHLYNLSVYMADLHQRMADAGLEVPPVPEMPERPPVVSTEQGDDLGHVYHPPPPPPPHEQQQQQHYNIDTQHQSPQTYSIQPPSHDEQQHHHHHHQQPPQDSSNDALPPGAISQLQAAAALGGGQSHQQQEPSQGHDHDQAEEGYVRASEYPAPKRPSLDGNDGSVHSQSRPGVEDENEGRYQITSATSGEAPNV